MPEDSPKLPPEICDHIVDLLRDDHLVLRQCCLISKSWVPRTRKYLFARVEVRRGYHLKWMETFPNPANSPGYHTRTLTIENKNDDYQQGSWLQAFSHVERLFLSLGVGSFWTLVHTPFHMLMPSLKSLHVISSVSYPYVFNLINSLPFLEDLSLEGVEYSTNVVVLPEVEPPTFPPLTGSLYICVGLVERTLALLLGLPGGLNFRKVTLSTITTPTHLQSAARLVTACSATLESFGIRYDLGGMSDFSHNGVFIHLTLADEPPPCLLDLSGATKLRNVVFTCGPESRQSGWITEALGTLTSEHKNLLQISILIPWPRHFTIDGDRITIKCAEDPGSRWWLLDHFLAKFLDSRSVRLEVMCPEVNFRTDIRMKGMRDWAVLLLPEATKRRAVDIIEPSY